MELKDFKFHEDSEWDKRIVGGIITGDYGKDFKDMIVVDIGANIGGFTAYAAQTAKHVYAFEPNKKNFELLKENTKQFKNVTLYNCGLGIPGKRKLYGYGNNYGNYSLMTYNGRKHSSEEEIEVCKLSDFNIPDIDFLKCDCEGAEYEIFLDEVKAKEMIIEGHLWVEPPFKELVSKLEKNYNIIVKPSMANSAKFIFAKIKL